ncbi:S8 family serine peptidase [Acinetobacter sp. ANC 5380]|uniref:S8 family serine peptidase n=2 Tax=Acinetobacter terrae TaxID=2731247 RepID=A0A7Y2REJ8_9GAMM|nr:S8 family serine peptidase [Acinetobacter terrae]
MQDLHDKYGVNLFNGSFGTRSAETEYKEILAKYAMNLVDGGSLIVFSTGNDGSSTPNIEALIPTFGDGIEKGFLAATGMDFTKKALYRDKNGAGANACGDTARWCVAADYEVLVYSEDLKGNAVFVGTSVYAPQITALAANIWSKYPWMTADQVRQTILTTANYVDDGSGQDLFNKTFGWGYFNPVAALKGPEMFSRIFGEQFIADVNSGLAIFSNDISGDAGLDKNGVGTLVLSGNNTFAGNTLVNNGELRVNGSIASLLTTVSSTGLLTGTGKVGEVLNSGTVSTEKGRLTIDGDYNQFDQHTPVLFYYCNNINSLICLEVLFNITNIDLYEN